MEDVSVLIKQHGLEFFNRYYSTYRGVVYKNNDPEKRGRLKLKIPQLWEDQVHEYWALPKGMHGGKGTTDFVIPDEGDSVWVMFTGGDQRFPVWEYGAWDNSRDAVSDCYDRDGKPTNRVIQTASGHRILINDTKKIIEIKNSDGEVITLSEKGIVIDDGKDNVISVHNGIVLSSNGDIKAGSESSSIPVVLATPEIQLWKSVLAILESFTIVPGTYTPNPGTIAALKALEPTVDSIKSQQVFVSK